MRAAPPQTSRPRVIAIAILALALVLRLALLAPAPLSPEAALAAAFGEHALCIPGASTGDPGQSLPPGKLPATGHGDHDLAGCCQWHASSAVLLPSTGAATRVAFAARVEHGLAATSSPPGRSLGRPQARGPPPVSL
jgi:hypothetical protein